MSVEKHRLQGIGSFPVGVAGCRGQAGIFARGADSGVAGAIGANPRARVRNPRCKHCGPRAASVQ